MPPATPAGGSRAPLPTTARAATPHSILRKPDSVQRCLAFLVTSTLAWIPANVLPIMNVTQLGDTNPSTILGGVATFWSQHSYLVAIIIFTASVLIPGLKLIALAWLCLLATGRLPINSSKANRIYLFTEFVGRWSMVDVFVVAILISLIRFGELMTIRPGPAALSFALVVIFTMLASHSFDPRLIWDRLRNNQPNRP